MPTQIGALALSKAESGYSTNCAKWNRKAALTWYSLETAGCAHACRGPTAARRSKKQAQAPIPTCWGTALICILRGFTASVPLPPISNHPIKTTRNFVPGGNTGSELGMLVIQKVPPDHRDFEVVVWAPTEPCVQCNV